MPRKQSINGERVITFSFFFASEMNMDFLPDLDFKWRDEFDQEQYTLLNPTIVALCIGIEESPRTYRKGG